MTTALDDATATRVAGFIPEAIATAVISYQQYALKDTEDMKAKEFTDHHKALKAAAAHLELLLKLQKMTAGPAAKAIENKVDNQEILHLLIAEAKNELLAYKRMPVIDADFIDIEEGEFEDSDEDGDYE